MRTPGGRLSLLVVTIAVVCASGSIVPRTLEASVTVRSRIGIPSSSFTRLSEQGRCSPVLSEQSSSSRVGCRWLQGRLVGPVRASGAGAFRSRVGIVGSPPPSMSAYALAADSSRARVFRWMVRDVGALGRKAVSPKVLVASAVALGGTFGLAWLDDDIYHHASRSYRGTFRDALEFVDYLGGPMINFPVLALAGGSLLTDNVKLQDAAWTSLQTLVYAGILGYTLKMIFGRERPEWSDDPYDFFKRSGMIPFLPEGNSSFPSGHAIAAFGILTPWVLYYPSIITYGLYILPIGTGFSRVALGKHWATDIVVGAVIGVSMGRWLTHRHRRAQEQDGPLEVSFMEGGRLFSVVLHFP